MAEYDLAVLERVLRPVAEARGLPNAFYTDPAMHEAEKTRVFFGNWAGAGFAKDVPEPGDAMPIDFLGNPLLAVRDKDGTVRVFQNVCRHRGMILVREKTRVRGLIRCPYHSWCYALDGALRKTPHVGGSNVNACDGVDPGELGLIEVRSRVWRDVIFVNVSGDAPAFEDYAAPLIDRWREFEQPVFHGGDDSSFKLDVASNWKLAIENNCESYHLPFVHPGLNSYSRIEDHYHLEIPGCCSGQGTTVYAPSLDESGRRFPDFADLGDKWETGAEYVSFFPNVMLGVHRDHAFAIVLQPLGPERTLEHVEVYYAREDALGPDFGAMRALNARMWKSVFVEDVGVVEGMQRGRHAVRFDGGKFSPVMDSPTHVFHQWVANQYV